MYPRAGSTRLHSNRSKILCGHVRDEKADDRRKVPFEEMNHVPFQFKNGYRMDVLGGDEPYLFRLEQGKHVLRLEASLGEFAPLIHEVEDSLLNLNAMYRKILMITGTNPDEFRDYRVEQRIPEPLEIFRFESDRLNVVAARLVELSGQSGDQEAPLKTMALQLDEMIEKPDTIPRRLEAYKTNTGGLGTWLQQAREHRWRSMPSMLPRPMSSCPRAGWVPVIR